MGEPDQRDLREALKTVAVALKETGLPFALIGGYGAWALGGPEPDHDVDFLIAEEDAAQVAQELANRDLVVVQPPEDWLFKVYVDHAMVDIIFGPLGVRTDPDLLHRAKEVEVLSILMPVLPATEQLVLKLNALSERYCDFAMLIPVARTLREQVDWDQVRSDTAVNDFALAFLFLLERLGIIKPSTSPLRQPKTP